jgi:general stress protein CsbA
MSQNLSSQIFTGLADVGRAENTMNYYISIVIAVILVLVGVVIMYKTHKYLIGLGFVVFAVLLVAYMKLAQNTAKSNSGVAAIDGIADIANVL